MKHKGFTLIELMLYVLITAVILSVITTIVMNILQARHVTRAEEVVQQNAQFVMNYMTQEIRRAEFISDVRPLSQQVHFYTSSTEEFFDLELIDNHIIQTMSVGSSTLQLTADPARVTDFVLTPVFDRVATTTVDGVRIQIAFEVGTSTSPFGYIDRTFETYVGIRNDE